MRRHTLLSMTFLIGAMSAASAHAQNADRAARHGVAPAERDRRACEVLR
jgi:hypothetical protein